MCQRVWVYIFFFIACKNVSALFQFLEFRLTSLLALRRRNAFLLFQTSTVQSRTVWCAFTADPVQNNLMFNFHSIFFHFFLPLSFCFFFFFYPVHFIQHINRFTAWMFSFGFDTLIHFFSFHKVDNACIFFLYSFSWLFIGCCLGKKGEAFLL